jgi:hypothetical protein
MKGGMEMPPKISDTSRVSPKGPLLEQRFDQNQN